MPRREIVRPPVLASLVAASLVNAVLLAAAACAEEPARSPAPSGVTASTGAASAAEEVAGISLPPGFVIERFAVDVPGARSLARGDDGTIFVGSRKPGKVYALRDDDGDGVAETVHVVDSGLRQPNGVAFRDGDLYVAEVSRILRYPAIESRLASPPEPQVVSEAYPSDRSHGWKFIAFGPDGALYVPVGAPCNVCRSEREIYASITRLPIAAGGTAGTPEIVAHGVRNTVGFDWHPETGELWFTDNGRDRLGNDRPPDELNVLRQPGQHFGFPFCHGRDVLDPEHAAGRSCDDFVPPVQELGPHVAALGMRFYTGDQFPAEYHGDVFLAEHGSWNRDTKIGYRVMRVPIEGGRAAGYEVFAEGWLDDGEVSGRPVDLLVLPDGSLLVSDDHAGAVYRIRYTGG